MRNSLLKVLAIGLYLLAFPVSHYGQQPSFIHHESTIDFDITEIDVFDQRIVFLYNLINDNRFNVINSEREGVFIVSADPSYEHIDLQETFADFKEQTTRSFLEMDKETLVETAIECKSRLPKEYIHSLMMDIYIKSRQNNLCANADPFCTDNGLYQFPAGVNAGSGETGPSYNCLHSTPNPAWYFMRIGTPGNITIHMYSTPSVDIDFCCWGPFDDPIAPCPSGLTGPKVVSCSYSTAATENCQIPTTAQTGQYYIMVITNYSNQTCNINFSKTSGTGTTDCGIMPPLVNNDGPFCVGDAIHLTANGQSGATYHWTGPNGYSSNLQNPTINSCTMSSAGDYVCTITVGTQSNNATTEVVVYPKPNADFNATLVCLGNSTEFMNTSTTNPFNQNMTYQWSFGDGQTSSQQHPTHQYTAAGNYTVTLTASCGGTCTSTKTKTVTVYANPVADAGEDQTVIYGATATLSGSGGSGTFNYHWEPADKVVNPNAQTTQTVALQQSTTFTLTATHPQGGCSSEDQVSVLVEGSNMTATASASPTSICLDETSQLHATGVGGTGNYTYAWTPTIGLSAPNIANPVAHPTETTTYTCLVSDGMSSQTVSTTVTVNYPEYEEIEQWICPDDAYTFYGQNYSEEGDYDYVTTTAQGCEKIITLHLHNYPSYSNAHTTTEYICPGTSCQFHGHYYHATGQYPEVLETIHGCDSVVWLNLNVYPANDTVPVTRDICIGQSYNFHGTEYSDDTDIYFDTLDDHGCLLVEHLMLTVGEYQTPQNYDPNKYICYGYDEEPEYYWDIAGRTYHENAVDSIVIAGPPGECDYKYMLNLKFHQEFFHQETVTACNEYPWHGHNYTATNHHITDPHTSGGSNFECDSIYVLDLTINYDDHSDIYVTDQCDEYVWDFGWNGESYTFTRPGDYTKTIETHLGCDSVVTLHLSMDYSPTFPRVEGNSWVIGGSEFQYTIENYWIDAPGTHSTEWFINSPEGFNKWDLVPYGDNYDRCALYIYTYELDSVELCARTISAGVCGSATKSKWIHCSSYGTLENTQNCHVEVYPNPNNGEMTLSFENMPGTVMVKVCDMTGNIKDSYTVTNGYEKQTHRYNSNRLSQGVYFFQFSSQAGTITKKVIILD